MDHSTRQEVGLVCGTYVKTRLRLCCSSYAVSSVTLVYQFTTLRITLRPDLPCFTGSWICVARMRMIRQIQLWQGDYTARDL